MDAVEVPAVIVDEAMVDNDEAQQPPAKRKSVSHTDRVVATVRHLGIPPDFITPNIFWKKDEEAGLWRELQFGPEQLAKDWRDQSQMVPVCHRCGLDRSCADDLCSSQL